MFWFLVLIVGTPLVGQYMPAVGLSFSGGLLGGGVQHEEKVCCTTRKVARLPGRISRLILSRLFTDHDLTGSSGRDVFKTSRVGSGQEVFETVWVGPGQVFIFHGWGWVGSRRPDPTRPDPTREDWPEPGKYLKFCRQRGRVLNKRRAMCP